MVRARCETAGPRLAALLAAALLGASCGSSSSSSSSSSGSGGTPGGAGGAAPAGSGGQSATGGAPPAQGSGGAPVQGSGGISGTGGASGAPGSGGAGRGGAAGAGAGATAGRAGGSGGNGGAVGWGLGAESRCTGSPFAVCEDFESTAAGATPVGWVVPPSNYGVGTVTVADDDAARGSHSLKVMIPTSTTSAEHYLQRGNLGALANGYFGRIFFKIQAPTTTAFVHWDLILGAGSYNGANRRIRWGVTGTGLGANGANWAWIYNIEQGDTGIESRVTHPVLDQWMCVEWQWVGGATQSTRFYFQDSEVLGFHVDGTFPGTTRPPQIPVFTSLSFGLAKYQNTTAPLVFWIDEIALDTQRIGCAN